VRMDAYARALRRAVTADSVVLDIGTGTGIFALLACQFGARRVYAVEPSSAIEVAREIAAANGYSDRIEFMQEHSTGITLPERADVIVSDLSGLLPWFQHHIPSIIDARQRLLAPGGALIPRRDTVWAAMVEAPEVYERIANVWDEARYGLNMEAARQVVLNTWRRARLAPKQLLVKPQCWATLDYYRVTNNDVYARMIWTAGRAGTAHGVGVWFDRDLSEEVHFRGAPDAPENISSVIYGNVLFPLSSPVALNPGDVISLTLQANLVGDDYIWRWETNVFDQGRAGKIKADFKQSSFFGTPLSPVQLCKRAAGYVPTLHENGEIERLILQSMDGCASLDDIARSVAARFPSRFVNWQHALNRVTELSEKFSR
ncbi:MAG: 50S ribosomal protein L11 methyltransferase, partial [Deltaproteobacteria bacterium]|nr:50S ribosomal protein L11 methyltransferase [Deltaproteobacteria bacterium]